MSDQRTWAVLEEVAAERRAQHEKWGQQDHPNGTGGTAMLRRRADVARKVCQEASVAGDVTYLHILHEEVCEAFAETDPAKLRAELVQVAAVAVQWIEKLDREAEASSIRGTCQDADQAGRAQAMLTIGRLRPVLGANEGLPVYFSDGRAVGLEDTRPASYRGFYEDVAIAVDEAPCTASQLDEALDRLDWIHGYKGGAYHVHEGTPLWAAEWGETGLPIVDVEVRDVLVLVLGEVPA